MSKKFTRTVAIVACFSILFLSIPAVSTAKVKTTNQDLQFDIVKHWKLFFSFLPILSPALSFERTAPEKNSLDPSNAVPTIKVTGTLTPLPPPIDPDEDEKKGN